MNLVHVRFLSDYYGVPPERVIEVRGHHPDVVAVNYEVARGKSGHGHDNGQVRRRRQRKRKGQRQALVPSFGSTPSDSPDYMPSANWRSDGLHVRDLPRLFQRTARQPMTCRLLSSAVALPLAAIFCLLVVVTVSGQSGRSGARRGRSRTGHTRFRAPRGAIQISRASGRTTTM